MNDTFHRPDPDNEPPELGPFSRLPIKLAGADPDYVLKKCPQDIGNLKAAGSIAIGSFGFNATVFTSVGSHLAGHFSFPVAAVCVGLASYTLIADSYNYFRCEQIVSGVEQLSQHSLQVVLPRKVRRAIRRSLAIRVAQSCATSLIVGVMSSLIVYSDDISARIRSDQLQDKAGIVRQISDQTNSDLKRANNAVNSTTSNIALLNRQINARLVRNARAADSAQVHSLEARKTAEETRLVTEKAELLKFATGLRSGPAGDLVLSHAGILMQIKALEQIAGDNWTIIFLIVLAHFVAMGFDLTPILAKMNWLPTKYSVLKAREYLDDMEAIVDEMVPTEISSVPDGQPAPANDNDVGETERAANDNTVVVQPVKRGRGRPLGSKSRPRGTNGSGNPLSDGDEQQ
jgi:hypothetical protein